MKIDIQYFRLYIMTMRDFFSKTQITKARLICVYYWGVLTILNPIGVLVSSCIE